MHDERGRGGAKEGDRPEIPEYVEGQVGIQARVDQERRAPDEQGMAVRRLLRDMRRCEVAVRADSVLDDKAMRERAAEAVRDQSREDVGLAARRRRDHHRDEAARVVLGGGRARERQQAHHPDKAAEFARHTPSMAKGSVGRGVKPLQDGGAWLALSTLQR